jgi:3-hydroxybutyryl-CoA dehydratase
MDTSGMHGYFFDDLSAGMTASFGKTITDADVVMFSAVSGDTNPMHLNEEFAKTTRAGTRLAHGMLTASLISTVLGCKLPGPGCLYVSQTAHFRAPVKVGDTVMAKVTVHRLLPQKNFAEFETSCTVGATTVVDGAALVWVPSRTAK